jgi:hypothetical protein
MKRLAIAAICVALCALALPGVRHAPAQQHDQAVTSYAAKLKVLQAKLKVLQKERIAILSRDVKILELQFKLGAADFNQFATAEVELVDAQLDCSDTPQERIAYLEKGTEVAKDAVEFVEVRYKSGYRQTELDVNQSKVIYLNLQIKLLKERQKLASSKGR